MMPAAEKACEQHGPAPRRKRHMNRYQPNDGAQEPNPIGIGTWVLIPIGLFLIGFVVLFQYGLGFFLGQDNHNQQGAADEPTVHTAQAGAQQETLQNMYCEHCCKWVYSHTRIMEHNAQHMYDMCMHTKFFF